MGSEVIVNFIKLSLLVVIACLLAVSIWQTNQTEERILNVQADLRDAKERLSGRMDELARELKERPVVVTRGEGGPATPPESVDPRTQPYWPTDDNILVDIAGEPKPPAGAPRGGIVKYYTGSNPRSLHTHVTNEAELQERICAPVYEYIANQSKNNPDDYVPGICNRVTVNDDYTVFTCYVRKGMYWQKPYLEPEEKRGRLAWLDRLPRQEVTAEDIKFNFDVVRDPLSECGPLASYLVDLDSVEVLDRYTVRITWKRSRYYNKGSTLNLVMIYPRFIYTRDEDGDELDPELVAPTYPQHWFNNKMCGTGPFRFAGFEPNQLIKLRRNDDWWGPDKPIIDGVDLRIISEPTVRLAMFKAGELDVMFLRPQDYRAEILEGGPGTLQDGIERGKYTLKKWEMFTYYFVGWNLRQFALKERAVRRALAHVYPRDRIIRDVYFGLAVPHDSPVHKWESSFATDLEEFPYDIEAARRILDEAGWKLNERGVREKVVEGQRRELKVKMLYPPQSSVARDVTLLLQKSAAEAGIIIESNPREWTVMTKMLDDKDFEGCMLGWGNSWDSDPSQIWHSESARAAKGSNFVSYINPELDAIIEKLKTEFDPARRKELWRKFQHIVVGDQPYRFTVIATRAWMINNRLGNHYFAKLRPQDWFLPWFVKEP